MSLSEYMQVFSVCFNSSPQLSFVTLLTIIVSLKSARREIVLLWLVMFTIIAMYTYSLHKSMYILCELPMALLFSRNIPKALPSVSKPSRKGWEPYKLTLG
jgi:hypothetical protein